MCVRIEVFGGGMMEFNWMDRLYVGYIVNMCEFVVIVEWEKWLCLDWIFGSLWKSVV